MRDVIIFIVGVLSALTIHSASAQKNDLQECTAISVPTSINLPIRAAGQLQQPPEEISVAFKEILNTVQLPAGFQAVGGGDGMVIACTNR